MSSEDIKDDNQVIATTEDKSVPLNGKPKKMSRLEERRQKQYLERCQRLINRGVKPEEVDTVIAREDYAALPNDKKIARLEALIGSFSKGVLTDIHALHSNDQTIADALDINLGGVAKMFVKLGISLEEQGQFLAQSRAEMHERMEARLAAERDIAQRKQELQDRPSPESVPVTPPDGATEFGSEG